MAISDYLNLFDRIMADNNMTEEMAIEMPFMMFMVKGMFFSGNYSEDSPASYVPKRGAREDHFLTSLVTFVDKGIKPEEIIGCEAVVRNKPFKVLTVEGGIGGQLNIYLKSLEGKK